MFLKMFSMSIKQPYHTPLAFITSACCMSTQTYPHFNTTLGMTDPCCTQGSLYLLLSDMVIQLFHNGMPFFLPRVCLV